MAIKAGAFTHFANGFLVDRIQSGGAGNLNIPEEKIYELGNRETVDTVRDTPDLSFDVESTDQTVEFEAILHNLDPGDIVDGDELDFATCVPIDIVSPFRGATGDAAVRGVVVPHLTLESVAYRFGIRQNATKQFTLRGDSIFYPMGPPRQEEFDAGAGGLGPYAFTYGPAFPYVESGITRHVYNARLMHADGSYTRLFVDVDFTTTVNNITLLDAPAAGDILQIVYGSNDALSLPQSIHPDATVKPGAVRHKDVFVYVGPQGGTLVRWLGLQSAEINWRINLDRDEELGNAQAVSVDYDVADVTGSLAMRAATVEYLWDRIAQVTGVNNANDTAGPYTSVLLEVEIVVVDPLTGSTLETLYVPDARFQPPPLQGRVQQKLETTFPFTSDSGSLLAYSGDRPAS